MGFRNPITSLSASQITPGTLDAGVIAQALADGTVTAAALAAGSVITSKIAVGVLATNLLANPGFEDTGQAAPTPGVRSSVPSWSLTPQVDSNGENFRYGNDAFAPDQGNGYALLSNKGTGVSGSLLRSAWAPVTAGYTYRVNARACEVNGYSTEFLLVSVNWSADGGATISGSSGYAICAVPGSVYGDVAYTTPAAPAGTNAASVTIYHRGNNVGAGPASFITVDSVALLRLGSPAVEITAGGIKMWDKFGQQTIAISGQTSVIGAGVLTATAGAKVYGDLNVTGNSVLSGGVHTYVVNSDTTLVAGAAPVTTSGANTFLSAVGEIQRVSSLRRYKLDREVIPAAYELLDVEPVTWHDAAVLAADPSATVRVAGFVAENVQDISTAAGGALDPLLVFDESGALAGLSYDRFVAYLLPIIADLHHRVLRLETP